MFNSMFSTASRRLVLFALACTAAALVACGGGGGGGSAAVSPVDSGSPASQPWKAVFNGASSLTYNATGCFGPEGSTDTAVVTLTRGTNTFVASITSGSVTLGPYTIGDDSAYWQYSLQVGTGTNTSVDLNAYLDNMYFGIYNSNGGQQYLNFDDYAADIYINCEQVTNPLTRAQLSLQPQVRIASFLAGTPTAVVSSVDIAPAGCNIYTGSGGTFTYAISPQGVTQIDTVALAANWLDTLNEPSAYYSEYVGNYSPTQRYSGIYFVVDSAYRGVGLYRNIYSSTDSEFNHYCGGDT